MFRVVLLQVSDMVLDGKVLNFYQWEGSLDEHMTKVKASLNELAEVRGPRGLVKGCRV